MQMEKYPIDVTSAVIFTEMSSIINGFQCIHVATNVSLINLWKNAGNLKNQKKKTKWMERKMRQKWESKVGGYINPTLVQDFYAFESRKTGDK